MTLLLVAFLFVTVLAECECGYSTVVNGSVDTLSYVFTDVIEADFLHIRNISLDTDWRRQNFSFTPEQGRGPYGMNYTIDNVVSNPIDKPTDWSGPGVFGPNAGVQLSVSPGIPSDGYIKGAELNSAREDLLWGTYRAGLKLTRVSGTCSAFFWYYNDAQEIDIEFLSALYVPENKTFPINLVLQTEASKAAGYDAQKSGTYILTNLPFDPTDGFHEYRIDFVPGNIVFYGDGIVLGRMNHSSIPTKPSPGHMILTHWSNGNPLWSHGPPAEEAVLTVSYVKSYFNSSSHNRTLQYASRCKNPHAYDSVCAIPDSSIDHVPIDGEDGATPAAPVASNYFFSDYENKTVGQTIYGKKSGADGFAVAWYLVWSAITVFTVLYVGGFA
ncbi:glycoside hydrolase family 16 protein [Calycina marina]|uniref:Glycoside hydrolase family 16 protein n=1 Tax=Calycina marina TaxID=1763456 RepID=A0A9P7YYH1_9HELO|nr:glycoside hydrolase family 16 protein [Calycina marina]